MTKNELTKKEITKSLKLLANPEIAEHSKRFFKTGPGEYGEGDLFLGIRVPVIRAQVKKYSSTSLNTALQLLKSDFHEIRLFALLMLVFRFKKDDDTEKEKIFKAYLNHSTYINNWDLVDSSAHHIVGAYLEDRDRGILTLLAKSASLWERRIAMMATYHFIKHHQFDDTIRIAEILLNDEQDLIHKVTGWMLREVGNRDLKTEETFLKRYYKQMPRVMLRYAIEKFPVDERKRYLAGLI